MLRTSERPPLRLTVNIVPPNGARARWGADDPDPGKQPQNLTFGTAMPGGFSDLSCTLQRDPRRSWPDLEELADITVRGVGGEVAWNGRLEQLPDTGGAQAQISPQAVGYQAHLDDDSSAAMIYVDQNLTAWQGAPLNRQILLDSIGDQLATGSTAADPGSNTPALMLEIDGAWASPNKPVAEAWYDSGAAAPIQKIWVSYDPGAAVGGGPWNGFVILTPDDAGATTEVSSNLATGSPFAGYFTPATPYRYAFLQHYYNSTPAGTDGQQYKSFWKLAVYGNHGLPLYQVPIEDPPGSGTIVLTDPSGVLASDVVAHALATWAPKIGFTTGPDGTIQPSTFVIPQLAFPTPGTVSPIIKQASQYELLDWAVWEGPLFYLNARGQSPKTRNWRCRIGDCQLQDTGPNVSRIWNGVIVQYSNVDGTTGTVGPPGSGAQVTDASLLDDDPLNPANQAGIRRWTLLQVNTTTPAGAIQIGAVFLREQKLVDTSGQANLVGHVQDDRGVFWPAWMVRAGDTLSIVDASSPSPRRIVSTSYDDSQKANTVQLDQPPDSLDALLDRLSAVIQPLGLT